MGRSSVMPTMMHRPVVAVILSENVNMRSLVVEAVAHKDLERDCQLFPPKHILQTAVGIAYIERNVDFHQPMCAG
jgi:hypothetical protein